MPNQNWVLAAQVHIPYSSPTSAVTFSNLNSQTATDDTGQVRTLTASQAPIYRMFARYTIHTSSTLSNGHAYSYIYTTGQHDYAQEWCGPNQIGSLYSSSFGTGSSSASYYSTGSYFGNGAMKNDYSNYAWGTAITDPNDPTVTVQPYDRRRRCVNIGCWEFYSTEQFYPVHQHWTICCTDGNSDGSSSTFNNEWGAYEIGCGGNNQGYSTNEFYFQMAYNFSGTFLFYRSCNGNFQVNE
tara:strand:- start:209 stop:928 length:720 start_codon:yes stop_codon:yes gene_type:complete